MKSEIVYMLAVVTVGFLVNYCLRALPFLLFAGKDRTLPRWIEQLGWYISPFIIGGLIVYSYSGLAWKTPWPYLAGVVTVALQVWKRNSLTSIVAGTVVYMVLLACCGCASQTVHGQFESEPELLIRSDGVYMGEERLDARSIVETLEDAEIPKTQAIHIKMDDNIRDLRNARALMKLLARGGYTRSLLVTEQHGASATKSGTHYQGPDRMGRRDDVLFYVTRQGVRFGLLTPVGPENLVKVLKDNQVQTDQLIRLCGQAADFGAKDILSVMYQMEDILRAAGYVNVKRFWLEDAAGSATRRRNDSPRGVR